MMNASSSENMNMGKQATKNEASKPKWLEDFLGKTFFIPCSAHLVHKNELNRYCIDCKVSACQHCVSTNSHRDHMILQIYKYVYNDVVSLAAMKNLVDCSQIQPYQSNKQLVVAVHPLPHRGSAVNDVTSCNTCRRRLKQPHLYRCCSISCMFMDRIEDSDDSAPPLIQSPCDRQEETPPPPPPSNFRKRKRKGTPHRAPFF